MDFILRQLQLVESERDFILNTPGEKLCRGILKQISNAAVKSNGIFLIMQIFLSNLSSIKNVLTLCWKGESIKNPEKSRLPTAIRAGETVAFPGCKF